MAIQEKEKVNIMNYSKEGYVYILFNRRNGTLYVGVTSNLIRHVYEHKKKIFKGFSSKYDVNKLGYYEVHTDMFSALEREKQIKAGSRSKKLALIEYMNPDWEDLFAKIV